MLSAIPLDVINARNGISRYTRIMTVVDAFDDTHRTLKLEVRARDGASPLQTADGGASEYAPWIHLITWTVTSKPFLGLEPSLGEVGVAP